MKAVFVSSVALAVIGSAAGQATDIHCGFRATCPYDTYCVPLYEDCTDLNHCSGRCWFKNEYPTCGGYSRNPKKCPEGCECVADPRVPTDIPDLPGICLSKDHSIYPMCGGHMGYRCPEGTYCYDDPWDSCDPNRGWADCPGICL